MKITAARAKELGLVLEGGMWVPSIRTKEMHKVVGVQQEEIVESTRRAAEVKRRLESQRPNPEALRTRLVECWRSMGLSAEASEKAADIHR
jgi:hypothetical protein